MFLTSKQIKKILSGRIRFDNFTTSVATSTICTNAIISSLLTGGFDNTPVNNIASLNQTTSGVITTSLNNTVLIFDSVNKKPLNDGLGNEIYGRLTESAGVYTLSYFKLIGGVETTHSMNGIDIDFEYGYRFEFKDLPTDVIIETKAKNINDDIGITSGGDIYICENLTITATNTVNNISVTGIILNTVIFYVNGIAIKNSNGIATTTSGAITVTPNILGYDLETTDELVVSYKYL